MVEVKVGVEGKRLFEEFSAGYYGLCTVGGMLSAGTTHLAITPLDVLKVHMQVSGNTNTWCSIFFFVLLFLFLELLSNSYGFLCSKFVFCRQSKKKRFVF